MYVSLLDIGKKVNSDIKIVVKNGITPFFDITDKVVRERSQ